MFHTDTPNLPTDGVDYQLIVYYILPASIPVIMFIIGLVYMCKNNCHLKISCECCKVTKPILVYINLIFYRTQVRS